MADVITELTTRVFADTTIAHDSTSGGSHRLRVVVDGGDDVEGQWASSHRAAQIGHEGVVFHGYHPIVAKKLYHPDSLQILLVDYGAAPE